VEKKVGGAARAPAPKAEGGGAAAPAPAGGGGAFDPAKATATLKVKATLKGEAPKMRPIEFDEKCGGLHKEKAVEERVVADAGKLANVIVYASSGAGKWTYRTPTETVVLDQRGCTYVPHVFTLMVNQPLTIKNSDPLSHNIHALPKNQDEFNHSQAKGEADLVEKFAKEEMPLKIKCDVHNWMGSWAGVFSHPFHGVTGADGTVSIRMPAGEFEITAWHEYDKFAKPAAQKVTLADGETKEIEFVFEAK
jgi:hypothetical protein